MSNSDKNPNILEVIEANAAAHVNEVAYVYFGPDGERVSLTWGELWRQSDALAEHMASVYPEKRPVVVYGHKHPLMAACFLACAKSGRAYCPVDASVPAQRLADIVQAVEPEVVLAVEPLPIDAPGAVDVLSLGRIKGLVDACPTRDLRDSWLAPGDVHYIIFTSGSTGKPKGVQITRGCLDNFAAWGATLCTAAADEGYVFLNQAPFSFDLSVFDLYLSLYLGGTEVALDKRLSSDMGALFETFRASGATVWVSTPSFADVCLADRSFCQELLLSLRTFLFCGETLTNRTADRLRAAFPQAEVWNTYGPTESTVAVTGVRVTDELSAKYSPLPVGTPKPGTWIRIEDERGTELPEGEKGEVVIVGDTVSVGYFRDEERTARAFTTRTADGAEWRAYRTGDEGYLQDGLLFYSGRIDLQVKLHGYRIEIEDIEANITRLPGVRQAAVLPVRRRDGEVRSLAAYVVAQNLDASADDAEHALRAGLEALLPSYMIPKRIHLVGELPRTANGKVDRKALAAGGTSASGARG